MSRCDICNQKVEEHELFHYQQGHVCKRCDERIRAARGSDVKRICNRCKG